MSGSIQIKVCGLTSLSDAAFAAAAGANSLGFILHPKSPRYISLEQFRSFSGRLPGKRKVAVVVEPAADVVASLREAGFDNFQIHFRHDVSKGTIASWSSALGPDRLWLAPKLPPGIDVPVEWLDLAHTFLLDTFDPNLFGGTGRTGDWPKFLRHSEGHPGNAWILSGGLNPGNVDEALTGSGALSVDVSSGVESAPGIKDHAKVEAFVAAVRKAAGR